MKLNFECTGPADEERAAEWLGAELERIAALVREGYTQGEVTLSNCEGVAFRGWWSTDRSDD